MMENYDSLIQNPINFRQFSLFFSRVDSKSTFLAYDKQVRRALGIFAFTTHTATLWKLNSFSRLEQISHIVASSVYIFRSTICEK